MEKKKVTRRKFLKVAGTVGLWLGAAASSLLEACAPKPTPAPAPPEAPTPAPVPPEAPTPTPVPPTAAPTVVPSVRKDLVVGLHADVPSFGAFTKLGETGPKVNESIIRRLARVSHETFQPEPELAVEWAMEDPTTWVIKLREGVQWHKGWGEVTAEDVEYTINYIVENQAYKYGTGILNVDYVKARSKYVVEVKLTQPFLAFPQVTMDHGGDICCKKAHLEMGEEEYKINPIGCGPFQFEEWVSGSHVIIKKFPDYWNPDQPKVEEVVFPIIPDASVRLAALEKGEIDWMDRINGKDIPRVRELEGFTFENVPGWNWDCLAFGFAPYIDAKYVTEDFPTQIKEVRQAISYAISRQDIIDAVYYGEGQPSDSPIPEGFPGYRPWPLKYPPEGDLETAKSLMAQAGVDGFDAEVIGLATMPWHVQELEVIAEQVKPLGINLSITAVEEGMWHERWYEHNFTMGMREISMVSADTDSCLYWFHRSGAKHWQGWPNAPDEWLDGARAETDPEKQKELYIKITDRVIDECPYIFTGHVNVIRLYDERLTGFRPWRVYFIMTLDDVGWTA